MKTYQLTQHFALNEFTRSATANAHGIDNTLDLTKADDRKVADIHPLWNVETRHATSLRAFRCLRGMPMRRGMPRLYGNGSISFRTIVASTS